MGLAVLSIRPYPRTARGRCPLGAVALAILLLGIVPASRANPPAAIAVIVAPDAADRTYDRALLAGIYRRKVVLDRDGRPYVPVNLPAADPVRRAFTRILFGQRPEDMESYWNEQYYQGVSPPYVLASPAAVRRFVESTPGAIGYVPACGDFTGISVVARLPLLAEEQSALTACEENPR